MLKAPVSGSVKTRLAADIGPDQAAAVYRNLVELQIAEIPSDWKIRICFSPTDAKSQMIDWLGNAHEFIPQSQGDLGNRLHHAMNQYFKKNSGNLFFLGGDCPYLNKNLLKEANQKLTSTDIVIGPTFDGGYYLLGMKEPTPCLFKEIQWSTEIVYQQTLTRLAEQKLNFEELKCLEDIDTLDTWKRFQKLQM